MAGMRVLVTGADGYCTTYEINHLGSVTLARACREAGVPRFVYTSSCSVYGAADDGGERSEQSAPNPQTAYARCKVLVERDVGALADSFATLRHLAPARACGSTSFSTTSRGSLGPPERSG
jgi:UDP-glucose 4-epimerase